MGLSGGRDLRDLGIAGFVRAGQSSIRLNPRLAIETWGTRLTKPNHPWTNGQVERMNRTNKDATVKRYFYDTHHQLKAHLNDFLRAYNFARRLKTLKGLTPYEYLCKFWTQDKDRFTLDPIHPMPGLNI